MFLLHHLNPTALAFVPLLGATSADGGGIWIETEEPPACALFGVVARLHKIPLSLWRRCCPPTDSLLSLTDSASPVGDGGKRYATPLG